MGVIDELPPQVGVFRHRLTVDQYHQMARAGVLAADARVELIDGEIIDMAPIGTGHWSVVSRLTDIFASALHGKAIVSVQSSLRLGDFSEPEPDLAVFKYRADFYAERHPTAADTLLVIEVADTTAPYDRNVKVPLYAKHGVPEVWIIDLEASIVRFYRRPEGERYLDTTTTATTGPTPISAMAGVTVDLSGVL
jgi:Uma2 family endonuclease